MNAALTLRHYLEAPIAHSHDHAQLVFGLSGHLDLEVDGLGSQVRESSVMVLPFSAHHACGSRDGSRCLVLDVPSEHWVLHSLATMPTPVDACSINRRAWRWTRGKTSWCNGSHTARWMTR